MAVLSNNDLTFANGGGTAFKTHGYEHYGNTRNITDTGLYTGYFTDTPNGNAEILSWLLSIRLADTADYIIHIWGVYNDDKIYMRRKNGGWDTIWHQISTT